MTQTVLILGGSGKIGSHSATAFQKAGWMVRHYNRSTGDMTKAAIGADVIVNGLNPPNYHNWAKLVPKMTKQIIAAAKASGATVIIPGNVYNFGNVTGQIDKTTPQRPNTRKGQIRVEMEAAFRQAGIPTIVLRAGHFLDPNRDGGAHSMVTMAKAGKGKLTAMGPSAALQAYAFLPDWANAAVQLAEIRADLNIFEDIPFPGHAFSINDLQPVVADALQRTVRITNFPWWIMRLAAPFWELARELIEMRYLTSMSHWLGADDFNRLLPDFQPSDMRTAMLAGLTPDIHPDQMVRSSRQPVLAK